MQTIPNHNNETQFVLNNGHMTVTVVAVVVEVVVLVARGCKQRRHVITWVIVSSLQYTDLGS